MAWWYYSAYLAVILASALLIAYFARVKINPGKFASAILPVSAAFILWDIAAVLLGHWQFGLENMLDIAVFNQPVEELAFFAVVPFFYVVVWEICRKRMK